MEQVISFILDLANQNPKIASIIMIIGGFRIIFKPVMLALEAFVQDSESKKDDEILAKVKGHVVYKVFSFILDYAFSIKTKKQS